jgi:purine/pyrimidine-nucleoside phosphorylase
MFKTNEYFDGKVKSIAFETPEGPATLGVMAPGDFEFGTSTWEHMTVITGALSILLPGASVWKTYVPGESFEVQAQQRFGVKVAANTSYLCRYGN